MCAVPIAVWCETNYDDDVVEEYLQNAKKRKHFGKRFFFYRLRTEITFMFKNIISDGNSENAFEDLWPLSETLFRNIVITSKSFTKDNPEKKTHSLEWEISTFHTEFDVTEKTITVRHYLKRPILDLYKAYPRHWEQLDDDLIGYAQTLMKLIAGSGNDYNGKIAKLISKKTKGELEKTEYRFTGELLEDTTGEPA